MVRIYKQIPKEPCIYKKTIIFDLILWAILLAILALLQKGWQEMHGNFDINHINSHISLNISALPYYTLRTTMRLLLGLIASFAFTFIFGVLAAKYVAFERIILPFVNFMESVPLVGFLTFTTVFFIAMYPHSMMGLEYAAVFGVFTGQAWNMMLIFYQTLRIIPSDLTESGKMFYHNSWQRFWKIECPYSMPGLLWNTMVSQAAAWFAILATESIPVKADTIELPGVGSYMAEALVHANTHAVIFAVIAIILNIIVLDQLMFRPLVCWVNRFKYEETSSLKKPSSWFYNVIVYSYSAKYLFAGFDHFCHFLIYTLPIFLVKIGLFRLEFSKLAKYMISRVWYVVIILSCIYLGVELWHYLPKVDMAKMPLLMLLTALRVFAAMALSIIIFVPVGVWIGLNHKAMHICQPIIQILAALPVNLFYPLIAVLLIAYHQGLGIWSIFLIMLGTQWYILFNVIAGVSTMPHNLIEVSQIFQVRGWLWWRKFMIPAIFPYIVTGIITAAGGAWNAAIVSELITWGKTTETTIGLGAYISANSTNNALAQSALGCTVMCFMVGLCIVFIWKPLYKIAETKYRVG